MCRSKEKSFSGCFTGGRDRGGRTVEVVVVLDLVPEEGTRAVDLLTSDNGDLLASEDLVI